MFITLEGIEGTGKSTHADSVCDFLRERGIAALKTREPGGSEIGEAVREWLLGYREMHSDTELLLMFAARAEHIHRVIRPALAAGQWVVSDRFTDASFAYQGGGRGIDSDRIAQLESWVQGAFRPDLTLLLDAPVDIAMRRIHKRGAPDRFEREKHAFFERVRAAYLDLAERNSQHYRILDASRSLAEVTHALTIVLADEFE
ncbi:MAG: dTMP kinase [Gammaproteobacteria bacterium]|nr:dTMP kinase [Gammaproteobacteria bacterium]